MQALFILIVLLPALAAGHFSSNCLRCICEVEGCYSQVGRCRQDAGSLSCGPYQIKSPYWTDCYRPGGDYQSCTKQMGCSEGCVRSYMSRYGHRGDTCQDYARMHNGGPNGYRRSSTLGYWSRVNACCQRSGGC